MGASHLLATWFGFGLSIFTRGLIYDFLCVATIERLFMGVAIGVVNGLVLLVLISQAQSKAKIAFS